MKKTLAMILSIVFIVCMLPMNALAATVETVDISKIDLPVAGNKPDLSAELGKASGAYKITLVEWTEYDADWEWQKDMTANDTFKEGYWYVVYVDVQTTSGNTFSNSVSGTINNKSAQLSGNSVQANGTKACFYMSYQATKRLTAINNVDLTVVKPVIGKTPTFAKVDTAQYVSEKYGTVSNCSNGVTWTNQGSGVNITVNNPFKEGVKYKVTYYLTAKDGYGFNYNTKCTVNGAAATVGITDATHITVSLSDLIPGDGKQEISSLDLSVTAPRDGEKPTYTKIDETGFYSDNGINGVSTKIYKNGIAWYKSASSYISPGTTETFKGGTEYTVKIALTPKDKYKFSASVTAKINGKTAAVETFDDGSITVSAKLTCSDQQSSEVPEVPEEPITSDGAASDPAQKPAEGTTEPANSTESITGSTNEPSDSEPAGAPATDVNSEQKDDAGRDNGALLWIILGVVVVIAVGAAITVVILKKKRTEKVDD